jgi:hypothetical protein
MPSTMTANIMDYVKDVVCEQKPQSKLSDLFVSDLWMYVESHLTLKNKFLLEWSFSYKTFRELTSDEVVYLKEYYEEEEYCDGYDIWDEEYNDDKMDDWYDNYSDTDDWCGYDDRD